MLFCPAPRHPDCQGSLAIAAEGVRQGIIGQRGQGLPKQPGIAVHFQTSLALQVEHNFALTELSREMGQRLFRQLACVETPPVQLALVGRDLLEGFTRSAARSRFSHQLPGGVTNEGQKIIQARASQVAARNLV